jgi:hypothetical protein
MGKMMNFDLITICSEMVNREIQAIEDKRFLDYMESIMACRYLGKALRDIPDTRWKKCKYYIKRLFGRIK